MTLCRNYCRALALLSLLVFAAPAAAQEDVLADLEFWKTATLEDITAAIESGADVNARNAEGQEAPLHWAAVLPTTEVAALLLQNGAELQAQDVIGLTPLHRAAGHGSLEVVVLLLEHGADVNAGNANGGTSLHWASAFSQRPEVLEALLEYQADIAARNNDGNTPLHIAAGFGKVPAVVQLLLDRGGDIQGRNNVGQTPLHFAAAGGNAAAADLLLQNGADPAAAGKDGLSPCDVDEQEVLQDLGAC